MKKYIVLTALVIMVLAGCSAKEFNEGVDSITSDASAVFDEGKDTSSK